jgi:hypothetical protein
LFFTNNQQNKQKTSRIFMKYLLALRALNKV